MLAKSPFVHGWGYRIGVLLEESGDYERLEDEEAAEVDAVDPVLAPRPALVERWRPRVWLGGIVERVRRIGDP